ncbi:MAG TPA: GNAT family N-acetyltransferase [Bryobacteraceae bacterium]|nr:GNAT family N-acetyltransferase [Bryobacteraceae bacterium]
MSRVLFLLAEEEEQGFIYGSERERRTMLVGDGTSFFGYLFWSENRAPSGAREPILRQLFVRKEFRERGVGTAMVQTWADRLASPLAERFGVESPNDHTLRMLVRLGYARRDGDSVVGTKCYFVTGM